MSVNVYDYDISIAQNELKFLFLPHIASQSTTQFTITDVGSFQDNITFFGNFTLSSGNISSGTITQVQFKGAFGLEAIVGGLNIPVTSSGSGFSFNTGPIFAPGSVYNSESYGSYLTGYGNDTYYAGNGSHVTPVAGSNTIYANGTGIQINLLGQLSSDAFVYSSKDSSLTVIDSTSSGLIIDKIIGSAMLNFGLGTPMVQDDNGTLSMTLGAAAASAYVNNTVPVKLAISDSAANVSMNLNTLETLAAASKISSISLTDGGTPTLSLTPASLTSDAAALADITSPYKVGFIGITVSSALAYKGTAPAVMDIFDSAANIQSSLDALQSLASAGQLSHIALNNPGIPTVSVTSDQSIKDAGALKAIGGSWVLDITAGASSQTIDGVAGEGALIHFSGNASQYSVAADGLGGVLVANSSATDHLHGATALQFGDFTDFVASETPATPNGISSFQVATLYSAVLARTPDVAGLAYYENMAATNAAIPITTYAQDFLQSPEYTSNPAHNYAQSASGDAQFINDTYSNLLHRAPAAGDVAWYQANVINPALANATPGTSGYTAAELAAHAAVLADFSQSGEFKGDVQVSAQAPTSAQHWLVLI